MKRLVSVLVFFLLGGLGWAATITIDDIPAAAVPNLQIQCELLRASLDRSPTDWEDGFHPLSNCAKEFIRLGSRAFTAQTSQAVRTAEAREAFEGDMTIYDTDYPMPTPAFCGNGVIDFFDDFVEECDDANSDNTDACVVTCKNATCGDGFVQAGVEDCDHASNNGQPGGSCSATCTSV